MKAEAKPLDRLLVAFYLCMSAIWLMNAHYTSLSGLTRAFEVIGSIYGFLAMREMWIAWFPR